jgi:hypothetical protein
MISEPTVRLAQTVDLSFTDTNTISKWTEMRLYMTQSPRSSIECVENDFRAYGTFGAKQCTYLESTLALYPNRPKQASI